MHLAHEDHQGLVRLSFWRRASVVLAKFRWRLYHVMIRCAVIL